MYKTSIEIPEVFKNKKTQTTNIVTRTGFQGFVVFKKYTRFTIIPS